MAAITTLPGKASDGGWKNWRIVTAAVFCVTIAARFVISLWPKDKRTPAELRAAEKERRKAIRRSLRKHDAKP
ncbi:MAG TPA: hypothetical protein VG269_20395 [Tepidisphaeraceae bacterium]|nr:hypothetical protein [Tepidisphaeraceae bacterium]